MRFIFAFFAVVFSASLALAGDAGRIDAFKRIGWGKTDFSKIRVELSEILSGGPPKDGIPAIDKPKFVALEKITDIGGREPVIGLSINGDVRAYPLRVLTWHEIVNDTVGGVPVAVTYCPLCNAAIVFERRVDGKLLDFGTTGLLRNSDLVMYDRQTESWWQQFTGKAIVGTYADRELKTVPARLESFDTFKKRFANARPKVLVPNNPGFRRYGRNPYANYDSAARPFLYSGSMPEGIKPMERVVVFKQDGKVKAYALPLLAKKTMIADGNVILSWRPGQASALDTSQIAKGRDVGNIIVREKKNGTLRDIVYDVTFAFVVHAFHPKAPIITE